jgi:hypothetical protein
MKLMGGSNPSDSGDATHPSHTLVVAADYR